MQWAALACVGAAIIIASGVSRGESVATTQPTTQPQFRSFGGGEEVRDKDGFYLYVKMGPAGKPARCIVIADLLPATAGEVDGQLTFEWIPSSDLPFKVSGISEISPLLTRFCNEHDRRQVEGQDILLSENPVQAYRAALAKNPGMSLKEFLTKSKEIGPLMEFFSKPGLG